MHYTLFHFRGSGTSPAPRNSRSKSGSSLQPLCLNQCWRGHGCSNGYRCYSHCYGWTGWSQYLQAEPQAASRGWRWWANRTLPPFPEVSLRWASNSDWLSIILASTQGSMTRIVMCAVICSNVHCAVMCIYWIFGHQSHGPHCNHVLHMAITSRQTGGRDWSLQMLVLLLHITTYYCILLHTWRFHLDFIAEGDIGTLDLYRLGLAINLDRHSNESFNLQYQTLFWLRTNSQADPFYDFRRPVQCTFHNQASFVLYLYSRN